MHKDHSSKYKLTLTGIFLLLDVSFEVVLPQSDVIYSILGVSPCQEIYLCWQPLGDVINRTVNMIGSGMNNAWALLLVIYLMNILVQLELALFVWVEGVSTQAQCWGSCPTEWYHILGLGLGLGLVCHCRAEPYPVLPACSWTMCQAETDTT